MKLISALHFGFGLLWRNLNIMLLLLMCLKRTNAGICCFAKVTFQTFIFKCTRQPVVLRVLCQVHQTTSSYPSVVDHLTLPSILYKCLFHFQKTMSVRFHLPPSSTIPLYPSLIVPGIPLEMGCSNQLLSGGNDEGEATDK